MAAALRYAARKVSGRIFDRPRVVYSAFVSRAVEKEPRRLFPRLIHGEMPPSSHIQFYSSTSSDPLSNNKHHLTSYKEFAATLEYIKNMDPVKLELQIEHKKKELLHLLIIMRVGAALRNKVTNKEDEDLLLRLLCKTQGNKTTKTIDASNRELQFMVGTVIFLAAVAVVQHKYLFG